MLREALTHLDNARLKTGVIGSVRTWAEAAGLECSLYALVTFVTNDHRITTYYAGEVWKGKTQDNSLVALAAYERDVTLADMREEDRRHVPEPDADSGYDHAVVPLYDRDEELKVLVVVAGPSTSLCKSLACVLAYSIQAAALTLEPLE